MLITVVSAYTLLSLIVAFIGGSLGYAGAQVEYQTGKLNLMPEEYHNKMRWKAAIINALISLVLWPYLIIAILLSYIPNLYRLPLVVYTSYGNKFELI